MNDFPKEKQIILFDGVCNLCNDFVLKVIKYDKKNNFLFTSLQSKTGEEILAHLNIDTTKIDSIILFEPTSTYYIKSSAALKIMNSFGSVWKLTYFFWLIPKPLRNLAYDFIAKNRYRWFGKKEQCMIPTPELTSKFLN
ncbi:thiol-disulfide oxidoreductase DCC family protein [Tenacibaculum jejuense]|uniref:Thiol-disulfide oxidoreductase n=1 Tax=Tenacibaculum jejuense TaxID=584609 RepID=A0A238UB21_9FLAO|nr:thiol-disulfide oxidoreductase DCC family protein [Tenacibaculum jejuense]SNR16397.1 conserved protein of unknown function [Tenacibaculum jejuense]